MKIRITAIRKASYPDLMAKYENPIEHACDVAGWLFWTLYALCGISDMVDGWQARKLYAETKAGAILDSVSDIIFVACCAIRLSPVLDIPTWLWLWAGVIVIIKIVNQISALVVYKRFCFPHTSANKLTGFLLFLTVPTMFWSMIPISIVAAIATFAKKGIISERRNLIWFY